jgi:hypothetical protein
LSTFRFVEPSNILNYTNTKTSDAGIGSVESDALCDEIDLDVVVVGLLKPPRTTKSKEEPCEAKKHAEGLTN